MFIKNLDLKASVIRREAVFTIGNLAQLDSERIIPPVIPSLIQFLEDTSIVLKGHTIIALSKIAQHYDENAPYIFSALISSADYLPRNRVGFLVESMEYFKDNPEVNIQAQNCVRAVDWGNH